MRAGVRRGLVAGGAGAALLASMLANEIISRWEGRRLDPYRDVVGVWTVCYGETRVPMRRYTESECRELLNESVQEFKGAVLRCNPGLKTRPYQLAAAVSLSYNIGVTAYCRSTVARLFNANQFKQACEAFKAWKFAGPSGNKREIRGLVNRRAEETKLCLTGL